MIDRTITALAAMHGIRVTAYTPAPQIMLPRDTAGADDQSPRLRVYWHDGGSDDYTDPREAEAALSAVLSQIDAAEQAALERAREWQQITVTAATERESWARIAAAVNDQLPPGCEIPTHPVDGMSLRSRGPMTTWVAEALSVWNRENAVRAARDALQRALEAEGAIMRETAALDFHASPWDQSCELWRPVHVAALENGDTITDGRVLAGTGSRRSLAWRHYGIARPVPVDAYIAAVESLDQAERIIREAAEQHRADAAALEGMI